MGLYVFPRYLLDSSFCPRISSYSAESAWGESIWAQDWIPNDDVRYQDKAVTKYGDLAKALRTTRHLLLFRHKSTDWAISLHRKTWLAVMVFNLINRYLGAGFADAAVVVCLALLIPSVVASTADATVHYYSFSKYRLPMALIVLACTRARRRFASLGSLS